MHGRDCHGDVGAAVDSDLEALPGFAPVVDCSDGSDKYHPFRSLVPTFPRIRFRASGENMTTKFGSAVPSSFDL
jgi:hypothetical protein